MDKQTFIVDKVDFVSNDVLQIGTAVDSYDKALSLFKLTLEEWMPPSSSVSVNEYWNWNGISGILEVPEKFLLVIREIKF